MELPQIPNREFQCVFWDLMIYKLLRWVSVFKTSSIHAFPWTLHWGGVHPIVTYHHPSSINFNSIRWDWKSQRLPIWSPSQNICRGNAKVKVVGLGFAVLSGVRLNQPVGSGGNATNIFGRSDQLWRRNVICKGAIYGQQLIKKLKTEDGEVIGWQHLAVHFQKIVLLL